MVLTLLASAACQRSEEDIQRLVDERITKALEVVPSPTVIDQSVPSEMSLERPNEIGIDFNNVYRAVWPSVFRIDTESDSGSGWMIGPGLILTVQHLVAGETSVVVRQANRPPMMAQVVGWDKSKDIALLEITSGQENMHRAVQEGGLKIGSVSTADIASFVLALGFSGTFGLTDFGGVGGATANVGVLSQITNFGPESYGLNLTIDAPVDPGDSGGPVLNSHGEVIGMVRFAPVTNGVQRVIGTFYGVHIDEIIRVLPALEAGRFLE